MPGDWYRFSAIIKPSKDKATISIKDNGDPDSFGLLVDNFVVRQKSSLVFVVMVKRLMKLIFVSNII